METRASRPATTLAREFNMLELEAVLKWEEVHPEPQSFDFSPADQIVGFAIRHSIKVRGHTLPDMGLHGQIFLDRIALEACARRGVAV